MRSVHLRRLAHIASMCLLLARAVAGQAEDAEEPASVTAPGALPDMRPTPTPTEPVRAASPLELAPLPGVGGDGAPPPPVVDEVAEDTDPRALTEFRPRLDPYGTWQADPTYGEVWVPHRSVVGDGFAPYVSSGRWERGGDGAWIWVSEYPFGDVVFHYGRWAWTRYGWGWIPGYRYSSAWVEWRGPTAAYAYYGWSPVPPSYIWVSGMAVGVGQPFPYYWVFCPRAHVFAARPRGYLVTHPPYVRTLARRTHHYVPAWPEPRARQAAVTPRAGVAMQPLLPRRAPVAYARRNVTTPEVGRQRPLSPRAVPYRDAGRSIRPAAGQVPMTYRRAPEPRVPFQRVVAPPPRVYSPGHGSGPSRRR